VYGFSICVEYQLFPPLDPRCKKARGSSISDMGGHGERSCELLVCKRGWLPDGCMSSVMRTNVNTDAVMRSPCLAEQTSFKKKRSTVLGSLVCCMVVHMCGLYLNDSDSSAGWRGFTQRYMIGSVMSFRPHVSEQLRPFSYPDSEFSPALSKVRRDPMGNDPLRSRPRFPGTRCPTTADGRRPPIVCRPW